MNSPRLSAAVVIGLTFLAAGLSLATAQDPGTDEPSVLELTSSEQYVKQLEFEVSTAEGKPFKLGYVGTRAMEQVKALVERFPDHPKVKELYERVRVCVRKSRGDSYEITAEMLAYRKLEETVRTTLGELADAEWKAYREKLEASAPYLAAPFPAPEPGDRDSESKMLCRRVILEGFEFPAREFTNTGRQYVHVGSVTQGIYYVELSNRDWLGAYEALKRYRREAAGELPGSWTIVGTVTGSDVLVPRTGEKGAADVARAGWLVTPEVIYVPGRTIARPDAGHPRGGAYSGEELLAGLKEPFLTKREVPVKVDPRELVEIYLAAVKEKNYPLYLECLDPDLQKTPLALEELRDFWDINQRSFAQDFVHVDIVDVGEPVAIQGEKLEGSLDGFFLDEEEKKEILARADDLVEELHVSVRRFDERGKQVGSPRQVILRRTKEGRWYVRNGLVL